MTLKKLIKALEKISKENPELKEQKVYCQVGREITYIDELNIQFEIKQKRPSQLYFETASSLSIMICVILPTWVVRS